MNKQVSFWRLGIGLLALSWGLMAVGCGSSQGTVSGKVTYQGKVVPGGSVLIVPAKGGVLRGDIKEDGNYTINKVPLGPAKVAVETESVKPADPTGPPQAMGAAAYYAKMPKPPENVPGGGNFPGPSLSQGDPKRYVAIPKKYNDTESSGLNLTVKGGNNPFDIDLK